MKTMVVKMYEEKQKTSKNSFILGPIQDLKSWKENWSRFFFVSFIDLIQIETKRSESHWNKLKR